MKADHLGYRFKKINDLMISDANANLKSLGLTFSQHHVLLYIEKQPEHRCTLKDLEHNFQTAQSTMAGIVARLEEKGFLVSETDPEDKRIKKIRVTDLGKDALLKTKEDMDRRDAHMILSLSEEEKAQLEYLLDKVYESLRSMHENEREEIC